MEENLAAEDIGIKASDQDAAQVQQSNDASGIQQSNPIDEQPLAVSSKKKPFKKVYTKIQILSELQLLVSSPSALILPILGFIGECILVRYQKEYRECLVKNYAVTDFENQNDDTIQIYLRVLIAFTFLYSFSFFFCIQPISKMVMSINTFMMELIIIGSVIASVIAFASVGKSKCADSAQAKMVTVLGAVLIFSGLITNLIKIFSFHTYNGTG